MINHPYTLVIEAITEPDYFGFYSPDLEGFTGISHSIENCIYQTRHGMKEFVEDLKANKQVVFAVNNRANIVIQATEEVADIANIGVNSQLDFATLFEVGKGGYLSSYLLQIESIYHA